MGVQKRCVRPTNIEFASRLSAKTLSSESNRVTDTPVNTIVLGEAEWFSVSVK